MVQNPGKLKLSPSMRVGVRRKFEKTDHRLLPGDFAELG